jgi:CRP-like cAMP-binding protein
MSVALDTMHYAPAMPAVKNPFKLSVVGGTAAGAARPSADDEDLRALQQVGMKVRFARNETIFNEGDEAAYCYKVISGAVRLCKHMTDGRRQIADFLLAGEFFGFLQFGAYKFTAEAVGDVVLMCYPQRQLERLSGSMPTMRGRLLMLLSRRLVEMQDHLMMLGRQTAKERVASFLLLIGERSDAEEGLAFDLPMGRQDIADYLGLTIETVCRVLTDLKRAKVIGLPSTNQVVINDMEELRDLAEGGE